MSLETFPLQETLARRTVGLDNATLVRRHDLTEWLASFNVTVDEPLRPFQAGQYVALGIRAGEGVLQRPYSIVQASGGRYQLEFFIRREPAGAFTSRLWQLPLGSRLRVGVPKGLFTLPADESRNRLFISTGTGLAPFLAMVAAEHERPVPRPVTLLHGVACQAEIGHRARLAAWRRDDVAVEYLPTVSRPADSSNAGWSGATGRVERLVEEICERRSIAPADTVAYLCGHPQMIENCRAILESRGFGPADLRVEHYQPVARLVRGPATTAA